MLYIISPLVYCTLAINFEAVAALYLIVNTTSEQRLSYIEREQLFDEKYRRNWDGGENTTIRRKLK